MLSVSDDHRQPIDPFPQIYISTGDHDSADIGNIIKNETPHAAACKAETPKYRLIIPESDHRADYSGWRRCGKDCLHRFRNQSFFYRNFYKRNFERTGDLREFTLFTDFSADFSVPVIVRFFRNAIFGKPLICRSNCRSVLTLSNDIYPIRPADNVS